MFDPGHRLGNYEIIRRLCAGGMATIYLARRVGAAGFARPVALKVIHPHLAENTEFAAMFVHEAKLCARIDHPNVVHVEELGQLKNKSTLFLAMEYVDGCSLADLVKGLAKLQRRLSPDFACALVAQVASGLHAAHETFDADGRPLGVIHRDVTPHNVLLSFDGHVKVIDFGIAKSNQQMQETRAGVIKGKVRFMSPEQAWARPMDRRSDVFSLGVVLWELLTLRPLFDAAGDVAVIHQLGDPNVAPPSQMGASSSPALDDVVLRALAAKPEDRPQTALEFRRLLLEAVPRAATIDASEIGDLVQAAFPGERSKRASRDSAKLQVGSPTHDSIRPPSEALAAGTVEDQEVDVDQLFADVDAGPHASLPSLRGATLSQRLETDARRSGMPTVSVIPSRIIRPRPFVVGASAGGLACTALIALVGRREVAVPPTPFPSAPTVAAAAQAPSPPPAPAPPTCGENMVKIPAGSFFMGSDDKEDFEFERPAHRVVLGKPFCIDVFEVTTDAYRAASDAGLVKRASQSNDWQGITGAEHKALDPLCNIRAPEDRGKHPINCVSWDMADAFCRAMNKRLPTEAEWEYAARGPDGRKYPWGDEPPGANFLNACGKECLAWGKKNHLDPTGMGAAMYGDDDGFPATAPVGSFPAGKSRYGVQDVVGNVWEWVADWYAPYVADEQSDPKGPADGEHRVARGGAWNGAMASWVRPTFRFHYAAAIRSHGIGFRCASSL